MKSFQRVANIYTRMHTHHFIRCTLPVPGCTLWTQVAFRKAFISHDTDSKRSWTVLGWLIQFYILKNLLAPDESLVPIAHWHLYGLRMFTHNCGFGPQRDQDLLNTSFLRERNARSSKRKAHCKTHTHKHTFLYWNIVCFD